MQESGRGRDDSQTASFRGVKLGPAPGTEVPKARSFLRCGETGVVVGMSSPTAESGQHCRGETGQEGLDYAHCRDREQGDVGTGSNRAY